MMGKTITSPIDELFDKISSLIERSRKHVRTSVNTTMVYTYYGVGYYIVEYEQGGKERAQYGESTLLLLSKKLTDKYGKGWGVDTLELSRKFFLTYQISETVFRKSDRSEIRNAVSEINTTNKINSVYPFPMPSFSRILTWSHYIQLMRIKNLDERRFYEVECEKQQWSVRELQRQYNSSLYERLALSRDKAEVMRLSHEGHIVEKPTDVLKNPLVLEFLGLRVEEAYSESKLETAVLNKLSRFLLEMGKGFLFEARQKKFVFNEDYYFVDLVLYNRLLQAYCLIDFKTDKLTHQDIGQMQMYVNYFDRYVKQDFEKPTIGILLCKEKNDALVELTLPKDANIYATEYALYLPDKSLLQSKLQEWLDEEDLD